MRTLWEYALPTGEGICDFDYESPMLIRNGHVFYISLRERYGRKRLLHCIDIKNGIGTAEEFQSQNGLCRPDHCFFVEYKEHMILCADDLFVCRRILTKP